MPPLDTPAPAPVPAPPGLRGQRALVTGASGGLGSAAALRLAAAGAELLLHYGRRRDLVATLAQEIAALGGRAQLLQANLRHAAEINAMAAGLATQSLDILVNNAGIWRATPLGQTAESDLDEMLAVNLKASFWLTQALLPHLRPGARIVNISSVAGRIGVAGGRSLYGATKAALDSFTRNWALELAPRGIRVNGVAPGYVMTEMTAAHFADPEVLRRAVARHPFGRLTSADEVAAAVLYFCSPESAGVTGQTLNVSGGFVI